jgi:DNA (cytosine-5)-methyltransferase 1
MSRELIIDSFAGGGGASTGIEAATGRAPDIAINHDGVALAMHQANHPNTLHLPHNIWKVDPVEVCAGRPVGLLWASPDCKHFSKAKGGKPVEKRIRDLAWVVVRWARQVSPRIIMLENVEEFATWGPLGDDGRPCPDRKGKTFKAWIGELRSLGYKVEYRELRACDYGAPTIRKRLFLIARRDGEPIVWPAPTHGDQKSDAVKSGQLLPWRVAAEIIDWSLPCPSIFLNPTEVKELWAASRIRVQRPLKPKTMERIAKGVFRYVINALTPFIVPITHGRDFRVNGIGEPLRTQTTAHRGEHAVVTPFVTKFNGKSTGHRADEPLHTITAAHSDHHPGGAPPLAVVAPYLIQRYGAPAPTITAQGGHLAEVRAFLMKYHGTGGQHADPRDPSPTIDTRDRIGVVTVHGVEYQIVDIGMRMLTPRERFNAQGFRPDYIIDLVVEKTLKTGRVVKRRISGDEQGRMVGNSVSPVIPEALLRANFRERDATPPKASEEFKLEAAE